MSHRPNEMQLNPLPPALLIAVLGLAGCHVAPVESLASVKSLGTVVPIYATKSAAEAIASGHIGAVPITLAGEDDIELMLPGQCLSKAAEVRSRDGNQGWASVDSLPPRLLNSQRC